jgi:four helix bundle protein
MQGYRDLKVWQLGIDITSLLYETTDKFTQREVYGLTSQIRRAAVSVPSNIAEGHTRGQTKDLIRFLGIARGSIAELETQLIVAKRLEYVSDEELKHVTKMLDEESRMLAGLRRSLTMKLRDQF